MKIVIRDEAVEDLEAIFAWIAKDNPSAAASVVRAIRQRFDLLLAPDDLTEEDWGIIDRRIEGSRRGEIATDKEVATVFDRHRRV